MITDVVPTRQEEHVYARPFSICKTCVRIATSPVGTTLTEMSVTRNVTHKYRSV